MNPKYKAREAAEAAFEEYLEAKAECGPGEEPDMERFRRQAAEHQERDFRGETIMYIPYEPDE